MFVRVVDEGSDVRRMAAVVEAAVDADADDVDFEDLGGTLISRLGWCILQRPRCEG